MKSRKIVAGVLLVVLGAAGTVLGDLSSGLMAYYPLNGNASDASGNGNNGTVHGATLTVDRLGNPSSAYSFDGIDDYIFVPDSDSLDLTTTGSVAPTGTLAAWVNVPTGAKDELTAVVAKMIHSSGGGVSYELLNRLVADPDHQVHQTIAGDAHDGSSNTSAYYYHDISDGTWHHLAFTWNGSEGRMYIDGRDATEFSTSGTGAMASSFDLYIGRYYYVPHSTWYSWDGSIDEVRIYNRALLADEIADLAGLEIDATVKIDPDTLNLNSEGNWVTCYVELPEGYDVSDIDVDSVSLEGLLEAQQSDIQDGVLMVKFDRQDLAAYLEIVLGVLPPVDVELVVTGNLTDGTPFEGRDTIRVTDKGGK